MVNKLTLPAKQNDVVNKVNEIIDDIPTNYVTTDTAQDVIGQKTIVGQTILKSSESASSGRNTVNGFALQDETGALIGRITTSTAGLNFHSTGGFYFRTIKSTGSLDFAGMSLTKTELSPALPVTTKKMDLGSTDTQWNDLYLYGKIYHGRSDTELTLPTQNGTLALTRDINNPTITFTQGGVTKGSFTLNQSGDQTIDLDAGGGGSYTAGTGIDITNDVISVTSAISNGASAGSTAVQPADLATVATTGSYNDLSGTPALATVATTGSYNDLSNKPTIPTVDQTYNGTSANAQSGVAVASAISTMLSTLYPVGSVYIGTQSTCPLASLISGSTWAKVSDGRVLQGSDSKHTAGSTIAAGLPNIQGTWGDALGWSITGTGAINTYVTAAHKTRGASSGNHIGFTFNAQQSSSIYGNSNTVQPPAFVVNIWKRTA